MDFSIEILREINLCRADPGGYSKFLQERIRNYDGCVYRRPGVGEIETEEGVKCLEEAISYMVNLAPLPMFEWSEDLYKASRIHIDDIGPLGLSGHFGSDLSDPSSRASKFCRWSGHIGENIDYSTINPKEIVISFLINDGDTSRSQRLNLLKSEFKYIGAAIGPHTQYKHLCVVLFSEEILESIQVSIPKKKVQKSEYVKIKQITEEEEELAQKRSKKKNEGGFNVNEDELNELREIFEKLGGNETGLIDFRDVQNLYDKGNLSNSSFLDKLHGMDLQSLGSLDFNKFIEAMSINQSVNPSISMIRPSNQQMISPIINKKDKFPNEMVADMKEIFDYLDIDHSGFIDLTARKTSPDNLDLDVMSNTLLEAIQNTEISHNNKLDFGAFLEAISESESSSQLLSNLSSNVRSLYYSPQFKQKPKKTSYEFHSFSKGKDCHQDFSQLTDGNIKDLFDCIDKNEKGSINLADFTEMMGDRLSQKDFEGFYEKLRVSNVNGSGSLDFEGFRKLIRNEVNIL